MSLTSQFKTDVTAATEGVWLEYAANSDGSVPAFLVARMGKQNKNYQKTLRKFSSRFLDTEGNILDASEQNTEEMEKALKLVFFSTILLGWRNFQPEDNGVEIPYSKETAIQIIGSPEWQDLYDSLNEKSVKASNFRKKVVAAETKNS